jgi:beta-N-acetylhexosaminidase
MRWLVLAMLLVLLALSGMPAHGQEGQDAQQLVERVAAALTPQQRVGQLLMVEFTGIDTGPDSVLAALLRDYKIGAVYLNASNCNIVNGAGQDPPQCQAYGFPTDADPDTPGQVASLDNALQTVACAATGVDVEGRSYCLPLFVSIDHEGDDQPLTRLRNRFTPMPSQMAIGATWDETQAETVGCIVGKELAAVGVNMLLGPVADVLDKPRSGERGDMGVRVFGGNAAWVAKLSRAYVRGVHDCGGDRVLTVTKHFPGHGGSTRDIEDEVASVSKSLSDLEALELVPFAEVARLDDDDPGGVTDAMMTAHLRYPPVQGSATAPPVSLDATALGAFMALPEFAPWREDHLLMADALGVVALRRLEPAGVPFQHCEVAKKAIMAGNDLIPLAPWYSGETDEGWERDQVPAIQATADCLAQQYSLDQAFKQRVDDALARVIRTKLQLYPNLSLEEILVDGAAAAGAVGQSRNAIYALARDAVTLVYPSQDELRNRLPRAPEAQERILFVECWPDPRCSQVTLNDSLGAMTLRLYGPAAGGQVSPANLSTITFGDLADLIDGKLEDDRAREIRQKLVDADWLIFAQADYNPNPSPIPASSALKRFLAPPWASLAVGKKLVVIAFNSPYHLDATELSKVTAYFAVYSKSEPFREAALRAVFQDLASFPGASPVDVEGAGYYLSYQLAPDPAVAIPLTLEPPEGGLTVGGTLRVQAGAILDHNGNPVADGRSVEFRFEPMAGAPVTVAAQTRDGAAEAEYQATAEGSLVITATSGGATSQARTVDVGGGPPPSTESPGIVSPSEGGGGVPWALVVAPPVGAAALAALGGASLLLYRRRRRPAALAAAAEAPLPPLWVDVDTRRVFLEGNELSLSGEQYRLLAFLKQNAGRVCTKDEVVGEVWPDMEASGVSEEAIDSLVHRVRERLRQAGATRQFIVTVRGQGYRLDLPG